MGIVWTCWKALLSINRLHMVQRDPPVGMQMLFALKKNNFAMCVAADGAHSLKITSEFALWGKTWPLKKHKQIWLERGVREREK